MDKCRKCICLECKEKLKIDPNKCEHMEINKNYSKSKRINLKNQMIDFIDAVLIAAEKENKLDYIDIEISNHQGNLQMDYRLRDRKKVY